MTILCRRCQCIIPLQRRDCPICLTDAGFPNVRHAYQQDESNALNNRYLTSHNFAKDRDCSGKLENFEIMASNSLAVINRSLSVVHDWLCGPSPYYVNFYTQIDYLGRNPRDDEWDAQRQSVESAVNPYCYDSISYGALTTNKTGMSYYGPYSILIKGDMIEHRSSIFEENPFIFLRKHQIGTGSPLPKGYRATWENRGILAVAKLSHKINKDTKQDEYHNILMGPDITDPKCDYIEVHIFGPIDKTCIKSIRGPKPKNRSEIYLLKRAVKSATALGIEFEVL